MELVQHRADFEDDHDDGDDNDDGTHACQFLHQACEVTHEAERRICITYDHRLVVLKSIQLYSKTCTPLVPIFIQPIGFRGLNDDSGRSGLGSTGY